MKVIHVIANLQGRGGAESALLRAAGYEPDGLVVTFGRADHFYRDALGDRLRAFGLLGPHNLGRAAVQFAKLLRSERPHVVQSWMYNANFAAAVANRSLVDRPRLVWGVRHSLDDLASEPRGTRLAIHANRVASKTMLRPSAIVYNSYRSRDQHQALGFGGSDQRVIHNSFCIPPAVDRIPGAIVGLVGRFHHNKGIDTAFAAMPQVIREIPDVRFHLVGRDLSLANPELEALRARFEVPPAALVAQDEIADVSSFYRGIDILVLPSRTESFPNVVGEAMASGVPSVVTDVGDTARLVGDSGIVVEPDSPSALAEGLIRMLGESPVERLVRSDMARRRITEGFTTATEQRLFLDVWGLTPG